MFDFWNNPTHITLISAVQLSEYGKSYCQWNSFWHLRRVIPSSSCSDGKICSIILLMMSKRKSSPPPNKASPSPSILQLLVSPSPRQLRVFFLSQIRYLIQGRPSMDDNHTSYSNVGLQKMALEFLHTHAPVLNSIHCQPKTLAHCNMS